MITKLLLASVFCIVPLIAMAAAAGSELFLSDNDIDLLVGVPNGMNEPLDYRRSRNIIQEVPQDTSNLLDEDFYINDSSVMPDWEDADEKLPDESEVEDEYNDLLLETANEDDLPIASDSIEDPTENDEIIEEQIETEQEL